MGIDTDALRNAVQRNCDIADAQYGSNYSLCIYLLKMREFFRWERGIDLSASLARDEVGSWLNERENLWESLENLEPETIQIGSEDFDPYDAEGINKVIQPLGLAYSAGLGQNGAPHFHLAKLERVDMQKGFTLIVSGKELARDLTSPPAMSRGGVIHVRRESLRRTIWEKVDGWNWSKPHNAMSHAIASYAVDTDLESALDAMTEDQIETVILHEIGEVRAGEILGNGWQQCLLELPFGKAELIARSLRDHLADCIVTLPTLVERGDAGSIHFYMAGLSSYRKTLFPALQGAYEDWLKNESMDAIGRIADQGRDHWQRCCQQILDACCVGESFDSDQLDALEARATL